MARKTQVTRDCHGVLQNHSSVTVVVKVCQQCKVRDLWRACGGINKVLIGHQEQCLCHEVTGTVNVSVQSSEALGLNRERACQVNFQSVWQFELPNGLEIDLTGTLTVQAQSFAALHGNINGTGNLVAQTLFLMSDQDLVYSTTGTPQVTNLALLADLDNNGDGTVVLQNPVAVSGNLRLSGHDIDGGVDGIRLTAQRMLLRSD